METKKLFNDDFINTLDQEEFGILKCQKNELDVLKYSESSYLSTIYPEVNSLINNKWKQMSSIEVFTYDSITGINLLINNIILSMVMPEDYSSPKDDFICNGLNVVIFDSLNRYSYETLEEYLKAIIKLKEIDLDINEYNEIIDNIRDNVTIIKFENLFDLLFKLTSLSNEHSDNLGLVVIDTLNANLAQTLQFNYFKRNLSYLFEKYDFEHELIQINVQRKTLMDQIEINILEAIQDIINGMKEEFNVNIIVTQFDFRQRDLTESHFKFGNVIEMNEDDEEVVEEELDENERKNQQNNENIVEVKDFVFTFKYFDSSIKVIRCWRNDENFAIVKFKRNEKNKVVMRIFELFDDIVYFKDEYQYEKNSIHKLNNK